MPTTVPPVQPQPDAAARAEGFQRVTDALQRLGHGHAPRWLEVAALTSQEAADALGVALGQIAKCVVFRRRDDGLAVLVIASGDRRVDEQRLAAIVEPVGRADAQYVKASTGLAKWPGRHSGWAFTSTRLHSTLSTRWRCCAWAWPARRRRSCPTAAWSNC